MNSPQQAVQSPLEERLLSTLSELGHDLDHPQLMWASGYLAGLAARTAEAPDTAKQSNASVTVLYAGETGNGERIANQFIAQSAERGLTVRAVAAAEYRPSDLTRETTVYFVVSTHGEGEPPQGAEALFRYLSRKRAPRLEQLRFSVLALGDRSYEQFCAAGRWIDTRLRALGAKAIGELIECDVDFEQSADRWRNSAIEDIARQSVKGSNVIAMPVPREVQRENIGRGTRDNPLSAEILEHNPITTADAYRQVHHLELGLGDTPLSWQPGDALGIVHRNPEVVVASLLAASKTDPDAKVSLGDDRLPLHRALSQHLEITHLHLGFIERYAGATENGTLLEALGSWDRQQTRASLTELQVADVIDRWPGEISAQSLVECLRPLSTRVYSLASAPESTPDELHLTVAHLTDQRQNRRRFGAASTYLCQDSAPGDSLSVYVQHNPSFHLPADDHPMIMIGAGTGVAPFRAFIEARAARGAGGANWLLFGNRHFQRDFLYQLEWLRHRKSGLLKHLDVVFSRDQRPGPAQDPASPRYVQHLLALHSTRLLRWLDEEAHLYVCGSIAMGKAVDAELTDSLAARSNHISLQSLTEQGRYHRDVY